MRTPLQTKLNGILSKSLTILPCHSFSTQSTHAVYPDAIVTLNGKEVTFPRIAEQIRFGNLRLRGAATTESPYYSGKLGIVSRGDIQGEAGVRLHTEKTIGISTTSASSIATRFAFGKFLRGTSGSVHAISVGLIPEEDRTYVPSVPNVNEIYFGEMETVLHHSIPEEVYFGYTSIAAWLLATKFHLNPCFVDSEILKQDATLLKLFYESIYDPFKSDIARKTREGNLTSFERETYQMGRSEFHNKYRLFAQAVMEEKKAKIEEPVESQPPRAKM